ncbi:MAG: PAS domain S-box protein [Pyrinomonadaceae bacterium]
MTAPASNVESLRLVTLRRYGILDSAPEGAFDDITAVAATACRATHAFISFINGDRIWFKATHGFELTELPRGFAFCDDVLEAGYLVVIEDAAADPRYSSSPLVTGPPRARFYAGVPLKTEDGYVLGALAVTNTEPGTLPPAGASALTALARQIVTLLRTRLDGTLLRQLVEQTPALIYRTDALGNFTFVNPACESLLGFPVDRLVGAHYLSLVHPDSRASVEEFYTSQSNLREPTTYFEFPVVASDGSEVWMGQHTNLLADGTRVTGFQAVARNVTRRRAAEEALRESEQRLRIALQAANAGTWEQDVETKAFTWSEEFYRIFGIESGSLEPGAESWLSLVHPDDRESVVKEIASALGAADNFEVEYRIVRPDDGTTRWVNVRGRRVPSGAGGGQGRVVGIVIDVTARREAEAEARRNAEYRMYESLVQTIGGIVWEYDPATCRFTFVSNQAERLLGYPLARWLEEPHFWSAHIHPEDRDAAVELCLRALEDGEDHDFEYRMVAADGRPVWLRDIASVVKREGAPALLRGVMVDITDKREAEVALRQSESKYRQLIEQASDGIVVMTGDGTITEANTRICEIMGGGCDDLLGHRVEDFIVEEDLEAEPLRLGELSAGDTLLSERRLRRLDGTFVPVEITARMLTGNGALVLAIIRDITARRRAEEMLRKSEEHLFKSQRMESIGSLAGGVAHDFNNIITGVFGFTDLALNQLLAFEAGRPLDAARLRRNLDEVKDVGRRGAALTKQLLAFSRQQQLERRSIDINQTVENVLGMLKRIVEENVTMDFYPAEDAGNVFADAGQIEQILANLTTNARDAMPKGGRLIIETENVTLDDAYASRHPYARPGRYVLLRVSDTGAGMPPEVQQHIYEPFFTTKPVDKGTGLGLATSYGIVKQHGGTIEVYSEVGHGTTFKIYLPLEDKPAEKPAEHARPSLVGGHETILLGEDERNLQEMERAILEDLGYRVIVARDGRDAVRVYEARHREIDLILLDVIMPRMDGPEAYHEMRELVPDTAPVIFMSGYSPEVIRARLEAEIAAGAGTLAKPYDAATLGRKVREALDARAPRPMGPRRLVNAE